jgi:hypothetical protein
MPTCETNPEKFGIHKSLMSRLSVYEKFYWVVGFGDGLRGEKGERAKI